MKLYPYLQLNGNASEAVAFYQKVFQAENLGVITFGEMPQDPDHPLPEEVKDLVAHAALKIGDSLLMFSDAFPDEPVQEGNNVTICIFFHDEETARKTFAALQEGGEVKMSLTETSFSPAYGVIKDQFGVIFQFYTERDEEYEMLRFE